MGIMLLWLRGGGEIGFGGGEKEGGVFGGRCFGAEVASQWVDFFSIGCNLGSGLWWKYRIVKHVQFRAVFQ